MKKDNLAWRSVGMKQATWDMLDSAAETVGTSTAELLRSVVDFMGDERDLVKNIADFRYKKSTGLEIE